MSCLIVLHQDIETRNGKISSLFFWGGGVKYHLLLHTQGQQYLMKHEVNYVRLFRQGSLTLTSAACVKHE